MPEVDELITIEPGDSVFRVASKIRGDFDVGILFPNSVRSAIETWLAGIPAPGRLLSAVARFFPESIHS